MIKLNAKSKLEGSVRSPEILIYATFNCFIWNIVNILKILNTIKHSVSFHHVFPAIFHQTDLSLIMYKEILISLS